MRADSRFGATDINFLKFHGKEHRAEILALATHPKRTLSLSPTQRSKNERVRRRSRCSGTLLDTYVRSTPMCDLHLVSMLTCLEKRLKVGDTLRSLVLFQVNLRVCRTCTNSGRKNNGILFSLRIDYSIFLKWHVS